MDKSNSLSSKIKSRTRKLRAVYKPCPMCMAQRPPKFRDLALHWKCRKCVKYTNENLCEWCEHNRLGHLVLHALPVPPWREDLLELFLDRDPDDSRFLPIGTTEGLADRAQSCRTCKIFLQALRENGISDERDNEVRIHVEMGCIGLGLEYDFSLAIYRQGTFPHPEFIGFVGEPKERHLTLLQKPERQVNWECVSKWVETCCTQHSDSAIETFRKGLPNGFRVVDVSRGCVIKAPLNCKYVCLSYVWGKRHESDLEARADNISFLETEGYLLQCGLPYTITDAIVACQRLKIPYLWVDRLCILQDKESREERAVQLNAMGDIYGQSVVTFVALAGEDPNYGLPGVHSVRRDPALSIATQGLYLIKKHEPYSALANRSTWMTRGWTFQEALLSPRLLLFSDSGAFFECRHESEVNDEDYTIRKSDSRVSRDRSRFSTPGYRHLLRQYTARALSNESDILDAVLGILNTKYGSDHYYGLPFCEFDRAILWWPMNGEYQMRTGQDGHVFPSWSWVSVMGNIMVLPTEKDLDESGYPFAQAENFIPLAVWAIISEKTAFRIIHPTSLDQPEQNMADTNRVRDRVHTPSLYARALVFAWKHGCCSGVLPNIFRHDLTWEQYEARIPSKWSTLRSIYKTAHKINLETGDLDNRFPQSYINRSAQPGKLLVHTQYLRLQTGGQPEEKDGRKGHYRGSDITLQNERGETVGSFLWKGANDEVSESAKVHSTKLCWDVLAVSLSVVQYSNYSENTRSGLNAREYDETSMGLFDSKGEPLQIKLLEGHPEQHALKYTVLVNLLVLKTHDGISKRVGIARAFLRSWIKECPEFGTFIIE